MRISFTHLAGAPGAAVVAPADVTLEALITDGAAPLRNYTGPMAADERFLSVTLTDVVSFTLSTAPDMQG
jgi:hypothetical protein